MVIRPNKLRQLAVTLAIVGGSWLTANPADAQLAEVASASANKSSPLHFEVRESNQKLEMVVNTSRILRVPHNVPRLLVNNPDLVRATPLSPNQIQLSALRPGVTQLNIWDEHENIYSLDVMVGGDARELQHVLDSEFPQANLTIRPINSSVMVSGHVPNAEMVSRIVRISEDYYPQVINNMSVGGVQQVLLNVKVMEVSRTKLRRLGVDWAYLNGQDFLVSGVSGLINAATTQTGGVLTGTGDTLRFGVVDGNETFGAFLEALRQNNLLKVLSEPKLVTVSGRPASFNSGGEFPIIVPQSLGTVSVEYRQFGTRVDFVPIVLGNGKIRLEVRPQVSEIDSSQSVTVNNITVPGLRTRWVDTAVEMKAGQTLALAGLMQNRVEAANRGVPWVSDLPYVGAAFRKVEETNNEIELLIMVTAELVDAMDPHEVPQCGPGQSTGSPDDCELYLKGYLEVPKCCTDGNCASCRYGSDSLHSSQIPHQGHHGHMHSAPGYPAPSYSTPGAPAHGTPAPAADPAESLPNPQDGAYRMNTPSLGAYSAGNGLPTVHRQEQMHASRVASAPINSSAPTPAMASQPQPPQIQNNPFRRPAGSVQQTARSTPLPPVYRPNSVPVQRASLPNQTNTASRPTSPYGNVPASGLIGPSGYDSID